MPSETNLQALLVRCPNGAPKPDDFDVLDGLMPTPDEGQILVRNSFLSLDPYIRGHRQLVGLRSRWVAIRTTCP